ncbi:DUF4160 domain-containing protein [Collinsella sp. An2]|uniref:DUF4160 domain-containing protein n=1 Tax=Collinsella sp. An2 TaxID=1965585 RepID=UPI000B38829E|nr:DUF4160 domain-containing protein [Collinsella sp. An2]OUP09153.1 hypothetical protein B5F33_05310 [Collinsella sp. An2]
MPAISMFYGIIIYMYYQDHVPPHFHARYQDEEACFTFDGELLQEEFPTKQKKLVAAWAVLNTDELNANWELARNKQELFRIRPL